MSLYLQYSGWLNNQLQLFNGSGVSLLMENVATHAAMVLQSQSKATSLWKTSLRLFYAANQF